MALHAMAQPRFSQPHGLYDGGTLTVAIQANDAEATIRYTTDGSEPNAKSKLYTGPLSVSKTTLLRAAEVKADTLCSPVATASYIFIGSVLSQSNNPAGYPSTWGAYTTISGTAKADYEMDPDMTGDATLRPKIIEGLKQLPCLSIVTAKENLFSHENDPDRGGIYIFTGPPVGDATGHGWTRPASVELFSAPPSSSLRSAALDQRSLATEGTQEGRLQGKNAQPLDFTTTCGLRLHGGHGRLAEKNPKHSFRLVFKEQYGPKTLKYPLFGDDQPSKFDQLVLRCHFGNSWQHWAENNRQEAQYTRDMWMRRMQRKIGRTSVDGRYVNLFINGMYWGLYNISERVDDQFGKDHLGGKKEDIDVVKIEEDGGNHHEASEGDLAAWNEMLQTVEQAADDASYARLDTLLDIDHFIDYMIINQYGGNTDWDHHNWYAIRRRGQDSQGFRFLCWDSEIVFENPAENILGKSNPGGYPTAIFQNLLKNEQFARRYLRRAKELLAPDGLLGEQAVVELWDSLYHTIDKAIYAEAARWGDYRRDVHRWQGNPTLYTVDNHYMNERRRLLNEYFPVRTDNVLSYITNYVDVDDFEAPDEWTPLAASMWHEWDRTDAKAKPLDTEVYAEMNLRRNVDGGGVVAGFSSVSYILFADLSSYDQLVLRGTGSRVRILANRLENHGPYKQIVVSFNSSDPYWDASLGAIVLPLERVKTAKTNEGLTRNDAFVHLNAIKVESGSTANVSAIYLTPGGENTGIAAATLHHDQPETGVFYSLSGQQVKQPAKGIYIRNGRKIVVR